MKRLVYFIAISGLLCMWVSCLEKNNHSIASQPQPTAPVNDKASSDSLDKNIIAEEIRPILRFSADSFKILSQIDTVVGETSYQFYHYEAPEDSFSKSYATYSLSYDTIHFTNEKLAGIVRMYLNDSISSKTLGDILSSNLVSINKKYGGTIPIGEDVVNIYPATWSDDNRIKFDFEIKSSKYFELRLDDESSDNFSGIFFHHLAEDTTVTFVGERIALIRSNLVSDKRDTIFITKKTLWDCCLKNGFTPDSDMNLFGLFKSNVYPFISGDTITIETTLNVMDTDYSISFFYRCWADGDTICHLFRD